MLLAALLDLGVPETVIHGPLADLGLAGRYRLEVEERRSSGLRGLHLQVHCLEQDPHHRPWGELRDLLMSAPLAPPLAEQVRQVFLQPSMPVDLGYGYSFLKNPPNCSLR